MSPALTWKRTLPRIDPSSRTFATALRMRTSSAPARPGISNNITRMDGQRRAAWMGMGDLRCGEDTPLVPGRRGRRGRLAWTVLAAAAVLAGDPVSAAERFGARVVERREILEAMRESRG